MITDADIVKLSQVFATKADLAQFATKDDLNKFATKDDLHGIRLDISNIRKDLNKFATKSDLQELRNDLRHEIRFAVNELVELITTTSKTTEARL